MDKLKILFHSILFIINILSIIIILQVVFEVIPCWKSDWPIDKVTRINDMVKDFSITVISSTFFYLVLVVIPEKIKQRFVRRRTQSTIDFIANAMQEIIAYLAYRCSISQNSQDPHYLKIEPKSFDTITDISKDKQTGFYYSTYQNYKKDITNVSNWDEVSFVYSRTEAIKKVASDYLDDLGIVFEQQQLVFLIRQIGRCSFISNVQMKCNNPRPIFVSNMSNSIKNFYSLYQSLYRYTVNMQELNVEDTDAAKVESIPVNYCPCNKTGIQPRNK